MFDKKFMLRLQKILFLQIRALSSNPDFSNIFQIWDRDLKIGHKKYVQN